MAASACYVTGNPSTPVVGSIYDADADVYLPLPGAINSERLPAYHELDLRLERQFVFDTWRLTAYLDVQNVYNRRNPERYQSSYENRERTVIPGVALAAGWALAGPRAARRPGPRAPRPAEGTEAPSRRRRRPARGSCACSR